MEVAILSDMGGAQDRTDEIVIVVKVKISHN